MLRYLSVLLFFIHFTLSAQVSTKHVIVLSIDGLRTDAAAAAASKSLLDLKSKSVFGSNARTIKPSITLPSHTSMLTGRDVRVHGISWNTYKPKKGMVKVPTIFEKAHNRGMTTAMFVGKEKFKHLLRPNTVDHFSFPGDEAMEVVDDFSKFVKAHGLPNLTFIHMPDPDLAGHRYRWMSKEYLKAVRRSGRAVKKVIATAEQAAPHDFTIIVTADHGGSGRHHKADKEIHWRIPWMTYGPKLKPKTLSQKIVTYDTAATALSLLGVTVPEKWEGKAVKLD